MLISPGKIRWSVNEEILDPLYIDLNYTSLTGVCIFVKIRRIVKKAVTLHRLHVYNQDVSLFPFLFKNIKIMVDFSKIQRIKGQLIFVSGHYPLQTIIRSWSIIIDLLGCYCVCFYVCCWQPLQFDTDSHQCLELTSQSTLKRTK